MSARPRLLIVTAAFGEGHNSAAKNLALALEAAGAETKVSDPCSQSTPFGTQLVSMGYRYVTTHFPGVWARIYRSTDRYDFSQPGSPVLNIPERFLDRLIEQYRPDAIVSTFPLYPYFIARTLEETGRSLPVFTVVTDSIEINASWLRAPTDYWLVTDSLTRDVMVEKGLPAEKIIDVGFAVNPAFSKLIPLAADDLCSPFRILYFPTANLSFIRRHGRALLDASPEVQLTIVLGKNVRTLHSRAKELQKAYPGRVKLIGWTRKVPQLLNCHHLVIGKAGGATVHEAIAARCPMLIHHLVPGQEEGNLRLLEAIKAGCLCDSAEALSAKVRELLADKASVWREMKKALIAHDRNSGGITSARFILDHLADKNQSVFMNFLFDIGRVLLDFDFESSLARLLPQDSVDTHERLERLLERKDEFEAGKIDVDTYTVWALNVLESAATADEFHHAWRDIFTPNEPMWQRARQLAADGHHLILFSNINGIHSPWIYDEFPEFSIFHGAVMSFQTGCIKPQPEIYQYAIDQYGLVPGETIYIDDLPQNVATGVAMGFRTWQYDLKDHAAFEQWLSEQLSS